MAYKQSERYKRLHRGIVRKQRHGADWRGIAWKYGFSCANHVSKGHPDCLGDEELEFHEPFGEARQPTMFKLQARVLLCKPCHLEEHITEYSNGFPLERGQVSMLVEDVYAEMEDTGGYWRWLHKYDVGHSLAPADQHQCKHFCVEQGLADLTLLRNAGLLVPHVRPASDYVV